MAERALPRGPRTQQYKDEEYDALVRRLATNVQRRRGRLGFSQEEAAHRCRISIRMYQRIEAAEANTTLVTLMRLGQGLEVDVSALLRPPRQKRSA